MGFTINSKTKLALQKKTKAAKKHHEYEVSLAAVAASTSNTLMPNLKLTRRCISLLKGLKKRARKTEKQQVARVAESAAKYRQVVPVLISEDGTIINGHIVVEAMKKLGATEVYCVVVDHLDEDELAALHVTLNRLGETGDWDVEALGPLLLEMEELEFDLETTGFSLSEVDIITSDTESEAKEPIEAAEPAPPEEVCSIPGDLWQLGKHWLFCGDATDAESYKTVLKEQLAACIFTDLPWNIPIAGFVSGLGKVKHEDFAQGAGEMSAAEFAQFCDKVHVLCSEVLADGAVLFSCIDWRSVDVIMAAGRKAGLRHINIAIWNKGSGGMGVPYRSAHELVCIFCKGDKLAVDNVKLGKNGRDRTNVWSYPGANKPGTSANKALAHHPTPKPVEMVADALLDVTKRGALVLDPFLGSGTTILAAEKSSRKACGIELDPAYVDVAIRRWEGMTGKLAIHAKTGLNFEQLKARRSAKSGKQAAA